MAGTGEPWRVLSGAGEVSSDCSKDAVYSL